jgi:hypothetical protein
MLGGSVVTTAWRVLRLRMEGTASRYGRVAANILNKQSRTADKGWCGLDRTSSAKGSVEGSCEHGDEPSGSLILLGVS